MEYSYEILTVALISVVMVISPGQDFAIITRNSIIYSRKAGVMGSLGIFTAIWLHVSYSLAGVAVLIDKTPVLYNGIKYAGAIYLLYLGIKGIITSGKFVTDKTNRNLNITSTEAFKNGFLSNALNPKTTLFFLSIFTQVVDVGTPLSIQLIFGLIIAISHLIWFILVAYFFSTKYFINKINTSRSIIDKTLGSILILMAISIVVK